jgi:hypothetical protein
VPEVGSVGRLEGRLSANLPLSELSKRRLSAKVERCGLWRGSPPGLGRLSLGFERGESLDRGGLSRAPVPTLLSSERGKV